MNSPRDAFIRKFREHRAKVRAGAARYTRAELYRLVEGYDATPDPADPRPWLKGKLRWARRRYRKSHWNYDFNPHLGLLQAWQAEIWAARESQS